MANEPSLSLESPGAVAETSAVRSENIDELDHDPHPLRVYLGVLGGLLFLTVVTVWVSFLNMGLMPAMIVAVMKALLVLLYFMNLRFDDRINTVIFLTGLFFLIVLIGPTIWDRETRRDLDPLRGETHKVTRPGYPPGVSEPLPPPAE